MIWLFRTDKIGDTVVSLPLDRVSPELGAGNARWFLHPSTLFLAENADPQRNARPLPKFWELVRLARAEKPAAAIVLHAAWWVSLALWLARVPVRAGRLSQWHSFLFFNRGVRQQRSLSERHETDYGQELVAAALAPKDIADRVPFLKLVATSRAPVFEKWDVQPGNYYVVHPGMTGSARNWPQKSYVTLIQKLAEKNTVVITGTQADARYLGEIESALKAHPKIRWTVDALAMPELLLLLSKARGVLAPSTGVLHLAASLGTPSVGLYSPTLAQHPRRWAARGPAISIILPDGDDAPDCMERITVARVLQTLDDTVKAAPAVERER